MNLPALANRFNELGIMGKAFRDLSRDEAVAMVQACWDALEPTDARRVPYWRGQELMIPFDAPAAFKSWLGYDGWLRMYHILEAMGASDSDRSRYLGPDWRERMAKRTQFSQNPCCPVCGGAMKKEAA